MKVYTEVVIDLYTAEIIDESWYWYSGDVDLCKGGGGGGGGTSGQVDYPSYMKTQHETWMNELAALINTATAGGSPFAGDSAFDPGTQIQDMMDEVCWFNDLVHNLDWQADWESAADVAKDKVDDWIDTSYVTTSVNAYSDDLGDDIANEVIPKFESGMLDVNAVYSSAFVVGEAIIYAKRTKEVAKYDADLRMRLHIMRGELLGKSVDALMANLARLLTSAQASAHYAVEGNRISIVAEKEKVDQDLLIEDKDARWDMDVYQYGANMLAAIGGGTANPGGMEGSKTTSALGGALSGAAAGAMIGSAFGGPLVGAGIGGLLGFFGGLFD